MRHLRNRLHGSSDQSEQSTCKHDQRYTRRYHHRWWYHSSPGRLGRRQLAYPIDQTAQAHYVLMNVEAGQAVIDELKPTSLQRCRYPQHDHAHQTP